MGLAERLRGWAFSLVLVSPMDRARRTAELAGLHTAVTDPDLLEWDYGDYEGRTTVEIRDGRPGWNLFDDGVPGGETLAEVADPRTGSSRGCGHSLGTWPAWPTPISSG